MRAEFIDPDLIPIAAGGSAADEKQDFVSYTIIVTRGEGMFKLMVVLFVAYRLRSILPVRTVVLCASMHGCVIVPVRTSICRF